MRDELGPRDIDVDQGIVAHLRERNVDAGECTVNLRMSQRPGKRRSGLHPWAVKRHSCRTYHELEMLLVEMSHMFTTHENPKVQTTSESLLRA
ncbi:hypothetical protein TRAPUB_2736 [Trametes pubescens]|uniref:Uncharacterized protein n=1 Tax=Trametes pubescens TaxID=154538 RepID=A0A1M2VFR4_TRAPU|nr:hypothetical protein TRAPUB_2736 [Trametes pubescens]